MIEQWRRQYNRVRPHAALGYRPPAPGSDGYLAQASKRTGVLATIADKYGVGEDELKSKVPTGSATAVPWPVYAASMHSNASTTFTQLQTWRGCSAIMIA